MTVAARHRVTYDAALLIEDAAERGWNPNDLARITGLHKSTVSRFLTGQTQTPTVAKALADALGRTPRRYLVRRAA
jgi:plasmid maintenance system antidote protein VapI